MKQLSAEAVVANTIRLTELLLSTKQVNWKDARDGVEFVKENLASRWPDHATTIRATLDAWIFARETRSALVLPFPPRTHHASSHNSDVDKTEVNGADAGLRLGRGAQFGHRVLEMNNDGALGDVDNVCRL
jgi:hypothetical protein